MKSKSFKNSKHEVVYAVKTALQNLNLNIEEESNDNTSITANYSGNFFSWGNKINIEISQSMAKEIQLSVKSVSKAQLVDLGSTNEELEQKIVNEVMKILG